MYASLMPVADPGEGPSPPPPYFWTKLRPKGPKKVCGGGDHLPPLSKGLDDLPPPPPYPALLTPVLHAL